VAERSGRLLGELVPAIRKTADLVQDVAAASAEQSAGVAAVSRAMGSVDQVTQQNATAAEELSSTAEEMASQAEALQQLISFFVIAGGAERGPRAVPAARPPGRAPAALPAPAHAPAPAPKAGAAQRTDAKPGKHEETAGAAARPHAELGGYKKF
jgi:methyl-accepting chemotaxis protein